MQAEVAATTLPTTTTAPPTTIPPTTTTALPTTTTFPVAEATIVDTGDLLPHLGVVGAATGPEGDIDFTRLLEELKPLVAGADLAICHMEVPMAGDEEGFSGFPVFNAPEALAAGVAEVGFDVCTTASNHSWDQGHDGLVHTLDVLDAAGLGHAGTYRDGAERAAPLLLDANGIRVALLSYTYGLNGFTQDNPWDVNLIDRSAILTDAHRARSAGADFVMLNMHWGEEYQHDPTQFQRDLAESLLPAVDLDLIVGEHAHVVQTIEKIGDEFVVYGEGNLMSNSLNGSSRTRDGIAVVITLRRDEAGVRATRVEYAPVHQERGGMRVLPAAGVLMSGEIGGEPAPEDLLAAVRDTYDHVVELVGTTPEIAPLPASLPT